MAVINAFGSWYFKKRLNQAQEAIDNPIDFQKNTLIELISNSANTEFGKKHDFKSIKSQLDYQNRFKVQDYEAIKPYVERLMKGEQNLLWPSEISWFAKSSGTTNDKSKFIPVSFESIEDCHFQGGKDLLTFYCSNVNETSLFDGKGLLIGGSHKINSFNENSFYGDLSAVLMNNMPTWVNLLKTPDKSIALLDDWEKKMDLMVKHTLNENVTNISGVPTWTMVLLNKLIELKKVNTIHDVWPNLELYIHGGVSFEPYRKPFSQIVDQNKMNYLETYNASEGFFGFQNDLNDKSMLLMPNYGIYYEFIKINDINTDNPNVYTLENVELNVSYAIIITTNSGLWRYLIGDTITFTNNRPFKFIINGRTKLYINAFGEELMIDNAEKAMTYACEKTNSSIVDFTAAPVYLENKTQGCHEWGIEFEKLPENIEVFRDLLDQKLKELNSDYEAKRHRNIALKEPIITIFKKNTFYYWLKERGKLGGQNKVPRLSNDRKIIEEIKSIIQL